MDKNPLEKVEFEAKQEEPRVVGEVAGIPVVVRRRVRTIQGAQETVARQPHSSSNNQQSRQSKRESKKKEGNG